LYQEEPIHPPFTCESLADRYIQRDARLDPPVLPPPGWFTAVEIGIVLPHVRNGLIDTVQVDGRPPDVVHLESALLDWTGAPRFEVGYRLPTGFGEVALAYRFIVSEGSGMIAGPDASAMLHSRLDLNTADLDYASREFSLWPHCDMKWRFGIRVADIFFDSRAVEPFDAAAAGSGIQETRLSNNFIGIGPHTGLELAQKFPSCGLALVAQIDGGTLLGQLRQGFFEGATATDANGLPMTGLTRRSNPQDVPMVTGFVGLRWLPAGGPRVHVDAGYQYEYWWNVGRLSTSGSRAELSDQGAVLRAEFNF
jgi:hypothetical protein